VPEGTMLLKAGRQAGIAIPTLCAHEAVSRSGACRLCVVEIKKEPERESLHPVFMPRKKA